MKADIRAMTVADIPAVLALWATCDGVELDVGDSAEEITRFLARNPELSTVAETGGRIIAAVQCGHDGRRGWLYHLAVAPDHRGQGLARAVAERSIAGLEAAGIRRALLFYAADNAAGHAFWLAQGWADMPSAKPMALDL